MISSAGALIVANVAPIPFRIDTPTPVVENFATSS